MSPVLQAKSDEGETVSVHIPPALAWALGILASVCSTGVVAGIGLLLSLNVRVSVIEQSRFTSADAIGMERSLESQFVPRSEIQSVLQDIRSRLMRIEERIDAQGRD